VCHTPKVNEYLYTNFLDEEELYNYINNSKTKCFYEIINGKQKPKFDIDISLTTYPNFNADALINTIIKSCKSVFLPNILKDDDILVYTSHGKDKLSYHIVINHWYHENNEDAYGFFYKVYKQTELYLGSIAKLIDSSVYKSNQAFRILGCHKINTFRVKMLSNNEYNLNHFKQSLITNTNDCKPLPSFKIDKMYKSYEVDLSSNEVAQVSTLLTKQFGELFKIRKITNNKIDLIKNKPYHCPLCKRTHFHENPYLLIFNDEVKWGCRRKNEETTKLNVSSEKLTLGKIEEDDKKEGEVGLVIGDKKIELNVVDTLSTTNFNQ